MLMSDSGVSLSEAPSPPFLRCAAVTAQRTDGAGFPPLAVQTSVKFWAWYRLNGAGVFSAITEMLFGGAVERREAVLVWIDHLRRQITHKWMEKRGNSREMRNPITPRGSVVKPALRGFPGDSAKGTLSVLLLPGGKRKRGRGWGMLWSCHRDWLKGATSHAYPFSCSRPPPGVGA